MLAFLKRRWILLSCAAVLLACSCIDCGYHDPGSTPPTRYGRSAGISGGTFVWHGAIIPVSGLRVVKSPQWYARAHSPKGGEGPVFRVWTEGRLVILIPLWLPLSAVIGWLVWRELRFREKRAKAAEAITQ